MFILFLPSLRLLVFWVHMEQRKLALRKPRSSKCHGCAVVWPPKIMPNLCKVLICFNPNAKIYTKLQFKKIFCCIFFNLFIWLLGFFWHIVLHKIFRSKFFTAQKNLLLKGLGKHKEKKIAFCSLSKITINFSGLHIGNYITVHILSPDELKSEQFYPILWESALNNNHPDCQGSVVTILSRRGVSLNIYSGWK